MDLAESIQRVMDDQLQIGHRFYEIFLDRCPQARVFFQGVDMQRQTHVLTMALLVIEQMHTNRFRATEEYLRYLGTKHHDRDIPEELYPQWREAMLETLHIAHGEQWDPALASQWKQMIDRAIQLMFEGYATRMTI